MTDTLPCNRRTTTNAAPCKQPWASDPGWRCPGCNGDGTRTVGAWIKSYDERCMCRSCAWRTAEARRVDPPPFTECRTCGNVYCPHAEWHGYRCTSSNEPGQVFEPLWENPNRPKEGAEA